MSRSAILVAAACGPTESHSTSTSRAHLDSDSDPYGDPYADPYPYEDEYGYADDEPIVVIAEGEDPFDDPALRYNTQNEPDLPPWQLSTGAYADYGIRVTNQGGYGLDVVTGPHYWGTAETPQPLSYELFDMAAIDQEINELEQAVASAAQGEIFVVGTHGYSGSGSLQALPPRELMASVAAGDALIVLSVCSAAQSFAYDDDRLSAKLALAWGADPSRVVGCTGKVVPVTAMDAANAGLAPSAAAAGPTLVCFGFWVNGSGEVVAPKATGVTLARYACGSSNHCSIQPDP